MYRDYYSSKHQCRVRFKELCSPYFFDTFLPLPYKHLLHRVGYGTGCINPAQALSLLKSLYQCVYHESPRRYDDSGLGDVLVKKVQFFVDNHWVSYDAAVTYYWHHHPQVQFVNHQLLMATYPYRLPKD